MTNLSTRILVNCHEQKGSECHSNPIIDIFREASERFGEHPIINRRIGKLRLVHLTNLPEDSVLSYTESLVGVDHEH